MVPGDNSMLMGSVGLLFWERTDPDGLLWFFISSRREVLLPKPPLSDTDYSISCILSGLDLLRAFSIKSMSEV